MHVPTFIHGSSEHAREHARDLAGTVDLVVTSPPYHNAISYESHAEDPEEDYRARSQLSYANEYLPFLDRVWSSCHAMLRPGGLLAVNVGTVLDSGYQFTLPQDIANRITKAPEEWEPHRLIIWNKVTAGVRRAGMAIKMRLPGYWRPNIMTEHILLFAKKGARVQTNADVPTGWFHSIWDFAPQPPRTVEHPAPFPEELPHRLIRMYTPEDGLVMDPFNGSGTTTKAAYDLGRESLGFDIEPTYLEYASARVARSSAVRRQQLNMTVQCASEFVPGKSRGKTRHGAGLATRRRRSET